MIETYAYGVRKYLVSEKEDIKRNNTIKRYKNINFDDAIKEETKKKKAKLVFNSRNSKQNKNINFENAIKKKKKKKKS